MNIETLDVLKNEFRKWYGMISVEELVTNNELIEFIKRIESYFLQVGMNGGTNEQCSVS